MKGVLLIAVFILSTLAIAINVSAAADTHYVATAADGGSDDNDGTLTNPWLTIGYAITEVTAGDTIEVADGTYAEAITLNKGVTLTSTTGDYRTSAAILTGKITLSSNIDGVTIEGFDFTFTNVDPGRAIVLAGNDLGDNLVIQSNKFTDATPDAVNNAVIRLVMTAGTFTGLLIDDNLIEGARGIDIWGGLSKSPVTITDNVITGDSTLGAFAGISVNDVSGIVSGNTISYTCDAGINVGPWCEDLTIYNNTITHAGKALWNNAGAINVHSDLTDINITGNTLAHSYDGLTITNQEGDIYGGFGILGDDIDVYLNNIFDNSHYGVFNDAVSGDLNATMNWWGDPAGPGYLDVAEGTDNDADLVGAGETVSDKVDYSTWLSTSIDEDYEILNSNPEMDAKFYKFDDTVTVTIYNGELNTRPTLKDSGTFIVGSNYPDQITVTLEETAVNSGIFEGTFTLLEAGTPTANQLLVEHASKLTVSYMGVNDVVIDNTSSAVDAVAPGIESLLPAENANETTTTPTIGATITYTADEGADSDLVVAWITLDGEVRDTVDDYGDLTYDVPEMASLDEGEHELSVTATDTAGNINTITWTFTVDTTDPTCTISMNTSELVSDEDVVEFLFVFDEDMDETVPVEIAGNATTHMTIDSQEWTDARTYAANCTLASGFNGTVIITAEDAKDVAGNEMTPANMTYYMDSLDPTAPDNLDATMEATSLVLTWDASEDIGSGMALYNIYKDDALIDSVDYPVTTYTETGIQESGTFNYIVGAVDLAGNEKNSTALEVDFELGDVTEWEISLEEGWNLFSLPLIPDVTSIEVILADIMENVEIIWGYDEDGFHSYLPAVPEFSELTDMVDGEGYWILMTADDSVTVYGVELPDPDELPPVYSVVEGWNLIGFKSVNEMAIASYLTTIPGDVMDSSVCYGWDATNQEYDMVYLGTVVTGDFYPGQGYWLYLNEDANIAPPAYVP